MLQVIQKPNKYAGVPEFAQGMLGGILGGLQQQQERQRQILENQQIAQFINKIKSGGAISASDIPTSADAREFGGLLTNAVANLIGKTTQQPLSPSQQISQKNLEYRTMLEEKEKAGTATKRELEILDKIRGGGSSPVHTEHYVQPLLNDLQKGASYAGNAMYQIPIEEFKTKEEHEDYAARMFGVDWETIVPRARQIIDEKFYNAQQKSPQLKKYWDSLPDDIKEKVDQKLSAGNSEKDIIDALRKDKLIK